jgi:hypothetical protein
MRCFAMEMPGAHESGNGWRSRDHAAASNDLG